MDDFFGPEAKTSVSAKCLKTVVHWNEIKVLKLEPSWYLNLNDPIEFPPELKKLHIQPQLNLAVLPNFPPTLEELTIEEFGRHADVESVTLPPLPTSLRKLEINFHASGKPLVLPPLPDSLRELKLNRLFLVNPLVLNEGLLKLDITHVNAGELVLSPFPESLRELKLSHVRLSNPLVLSEGLEKLELDHTRSEGPLSDTPQNANLSNIPASLTHLTLTFQTINTILPFLATGSGLSTVSFRSCQGNTVPTFPNTVRSLSLTGYKVLNDADPKVLVMPSSLTVLNLNIGGINKSPCQVRVLERVSPVLKSLFAANSELQIIKAVDFPNTLEDLYLDNTQIKEIPNLPPSIVIVGLKNCTALPAELQQLLEQNQDAVYPGLLRNDGLKKFREGLESYNLKRLGRNLTAMGQAFGGPGGRPPPNPDAPGLYDPFGEIAAAEEARRAARTAGEAFGENAPENVLSRIGSFLTGIEAPRKAQQAIVREKVSRPAGAPGAGLGGRRTRRKHRRQPVQNSRKGRKDRK